MEEKQKIRILDSIFVFFIVVFSFVVLFLFLQPRNFGGGLTASFGTPGTTNSSSTCTGTTSTIIIASSSARQFLYIEDGGTSTMSICFSGSCVAQQGIQLFGTAATTSQNGSFYFIPIFPPNFYVGPISCIMNAGGTTTVSYIVNQ